MIIHEKGKMYAGKQMKKPDFQVCDQDPENPAREVTISIRIDVESIKRL